MDYRPLQDVHELDFGILDGGEIKKDFVFKRPTQRIRLAIGEAIAKHKDYPGKGVVEALRLSIERLCGRDIGKMTADEATEFIARLKYPDVMLLLYKRFQLRKPGGVELKPMVCGVCGERIEAPLVDVGAMPVYPAKQGSTLVDLSEPLVVGTQSYSSLTVSVPSWRETFWRLPAAQYSRSQSWRWAVLRGAIAEMVPEESLLDMLEADAAALSDAVDSICGGVVPIARYRHEACGEEIAVSIDWTDADFL